MLYRLKDRLRRGYFSWRVRHLLHTDPLVLGDVTSPVVLSQLQHKDVLMYLLAIKGFSQQVLPGAVHVVDDGSLTASDRALLNAHIPRLAFHELDEFRSPACPTGGTWERLLAISELVQENYVIQLDSDTLTLGPLPEVALAVRETTGFVIGTWDKQDIEPMAEVQERATTKLGAQRNAHIQLMAEANFHRISNYRSLRYVRGCSGFAGFPAGSFSREFIEAVSVEMAHSLGDKWREWGSEQVMSNIVVANLPKMRVLPHPKYTDCQKMRLPETVFVHFIGSCRFRNGAYASLARNIIDTLGGK
jgi:hypothetical protein